MSSPTLHRRRFLQGLGVSLALPTFDSLHTGFAAPAKLTTPKRLLCVGSHLGFYPGNFFPETAGEDYEISPTLKGIEKHRDDFTVFSSLDDGANGGHSAVHSFLSGVKKSEASGFKTKNMTLDQAAAEFVGSAARYPSIVAGLENGTNLSWNRAGVRIPPVNNPAKLFQALFVEANAASKDSERVRLMHRSSVLDALRESAKQLEGKLSASDRDKLDQYLTSVREVEKQLQMSKEWLGRPKPNSPIEEIEDQERMHLEEMPLFYELLTLALQTDSTRVASFEIPMGFNTSELDLDSYHGLSHHGKEAGRLEQLEIVEAYFMKQFNFLLDQLKEAKLFDDTMVVMGSGMGNAHSHSNRNLPVILAGGGIRHRGHVACPEEPHRVPLSNLWLSTLQWFGMEIEQFGRSKGTFSPMELA
jgi:hypothetical protein